MIILSYVLLFHKLHVQKDTVGVYIQQETHGHIKGRSCAYGQPQSHTTKKEDTTLPTVSTESVFVTSTIDAFVG